MIVGEVIGQEEGKGEKGKRVKDPELKSLPSREEGVGVRGVE